MSQVLQVLIDYCHFHPLHHGNQMFFVNLKSSQMSYSGHSDSFEYVCYGSTAFTNIFYSFSAGIDFSRQNLTSRGVRF